MREWLVYLTELAVLGINFIALAVIAYATLEALVRGVRLVRQADDHLRVDLWLRYGRWLVGGLTFQLAADIVETAITDNWESIGRLAAIAAIRTFVNYSLERDIEGLRERRERRARAASTGAVHG
ncbi:DUF1622 domain-containing protein [Ramlibacter sp. G-1-2-2]|uniref:DUF1622 domain-containing protein n=1 Tax=Ramlibacter agri TaxID=2728837 RepID=A0A848H136_9BURK|nr:DUF1622 domain-containing protein [Ramlibacter agri]NML44284.1 DUF1622 domain-containing protein [Ramlibacter agri]